jgi:effector-binding domain-containing protein
MEIVDLEPTTIARVRMSSSANTVARDIRAALDKVWEVIRSGHVVAGHNVAVYHGGFGDVEFGVQVAEAFAPVGNIEPATSPSGPAAHEVHRGPYSELGSAHARLREWAVAEHHDLSHVVVEVYGDWTEDESELRTDLFHMLRPG